MPTVCVASSPAARETFEQVLQLPPGATVRDAVAASGMAAACPGLDWQAMTPGVWGHAVAWERVLVEGDRIELCRPLLVDPKVARRERFKRQGGKAGY